MAKAKKLSEKQLAIIEQRNNQIKQLDEIVDKLGKKLDDLRHKQKTLGLLQSVSIGLYDELDKLAKKAGADLVTDLALEQVNDFIRDSKVLLAEDPYVQKQKEFIAAGDNPQHRDVVVVLRQLRQGLERFAADNNSLQEKVEGLLAEAKDVHIAVEIFLEDPETGVTSEDLKSHHVTLTEHWMEGDSYERTFSFEMLDQTNIPEYFKAE